MATVLIVDDDAEWRSTLAGMLEAEYTTRCAANGDEALALAARHSIQVIVLDVMMPDGKDGFATFGSLQQDPRTKGIPVIILSAVNQATGLDFSSQSIRQYLGAAPFAFLEKPTTAAQLLKTIQAALQCSPPANGPTRNPTKA